MIWTEGNLGNNEAGVRPENPYKRPTLNDWPGDGNMKVRLLPEIRKAPAMRGYLAAVAIARDEGTYLAEWLEFHRLIGCEHMYLYDNGSVDNTADALRPYVDSGFVTWIPWVRFERNTHVQKQAYAHALCTFGPQWRWMAFLDIDEFLFPVEEASLQSILPAYEDLPAIATHWHTFGTSGHKRRPAGLVIENYTHRARIPSSADSKGKLTRWKSVVDPTRVRAIDVHLFTLDHHVAGAYDESRRWITKEHGRATTTSRVLRLNHYFTRSEEDYSAKLAKGAFRKDQDSGYRRRQRLAEMIEQDTVYDDTILRFVQPLRERLAGR